MKIFNHKLNLGNRKKSFSQEKSKNRLSKKYIFSSNCQYHINAKKNTHQDKASKYHLILVQVFKFLKFQICQRTIIQTHIEFQHL